MRRRVGVECLILAASLALQSCTMKEMIYPAPPVGVPSPPPPPLEEVLIEVDSQTVVGWHLPSTGGVERPAVLFLHGNGENLQTMRLGGSFDRLARLEVPVLALDYPGYGRSGGSPSEPSLMAAGDAALSWLQRRYPERQSVVVGWSLGAAVAVSLAARHPEDVGGLVALSPWTSLAAVAELHFPRFLVGMLLREKYDSVAAATTVVAPSLVVHGARDEIIPAGQGRAVHSALGDDSVWLEIESAGHNDLLSVDEVWSSLMRFLDGL